MISPIISSRPYGTARESACRTRGTALVVRLYLNGHLMSLKFFL
jgi:hypothetical protein